MGTRSWITTHRAWRGLIAIAALACAGRAAAEMDHLTGYKVKDAVTPLQSVHAVQDALGSGNCTLKKPKFYLTGAEKDGGDDPRGAAAGDYICYTAKCDVPEPVLPVKDDQLAAHALEAKKVKIVCLPAANDGCGDGNLDGAEQCDGSADAACPGACQPDCTCDPCPGGEMVGGFCWVIATFGQSCDTACAAIGQTCDPATINYAGSAGTLANCQAVVSALVEGTVSDAAGCSAGLGCAGASFGVGDARRLRPRAPHLTRASADSALASKPDP